MNCPECDAAEALCASRFDDFLVLEFRDAVYGAVHHLTVAAYMLQHSSRLTREGWLCERQLLHEFSIDSKPPGLVRQQSKDLVDSSRRKFQIKSVDGLPVIGRTTWTKTILDVSTGSAEAYRETVAAWARATLEDVQAAAVPSPVL